MDDRIDDGLLFVLLDRTAQDSLDALDARLRALPGAAEVTWWDNQYPNYLQVLGHKHANQKPVLEPFGTVGIVEFKGPIDPAVAPKDLRSMLFRRCPRPSQGRFRPPALGLQLAMFSPVDLNDEAMHQTLRNWADFIHLGYISEANVPGFGLITPYENVDRSARPRFIHLYEFTERDVDAVFRRCRPLVLHRFGGPEQGKAAFEYWGIPSIGVVDNVSVISRIERKDDPSLRNFPLSLPGSPPWLAAR